MQLGMVLNTQAEECKHLIYCTEVSNCKPLSVPLPLPPPDISAARLAVGTDPGAGRPWGILMAKCHAGLGHVKGIRLSACPRLSLSQANTDPWLYSKALVSHHRRFKGSFSRKLNLSLDQSQLITELVQIH